MWKRCFISEIGGEGIQTNKIVDFSCLHVHMFTKLSKEKIKLWNCLRSRKNDYVLEKNFHVTFELHCSFFVTESSRDLLFCFECVVIGLFFLLLALTFAIPYLFVQLTRKTTNISGAEVRLRLHVSLQMINEWKKEYLKKTKTNKMKRKNCFVFL